MRGIITKSTKPFDYENKRGDKYKAVSGFVLFSDGTSADFFVKSAAPLNVGEVVEASYNRWGKIDSVYSLGINADKSLSVVYDKIRGKEAAF